MTIAAAAQTQWLDVVLLRQGLYRLLAGVFQPPTAERVEGLRQGAEVLGDMGLAQFPFANSVLPLLGVLRTPGDLVAADVEHVRLFESGVDGALCPPTESYYLSESVGSVIGGLQRDCLQLGLAVRRDGTLEPDHVATLLEVQSVLCSEEAHGWGAGDQDAVSRAIRNERWFMERHLARWVTAFAGRILRAEAGSPYDRAGPAVEAVVRSDRQLLAALTVEIGVDSP